LAIPANLANRCIVKGVNKSVMGYFQSHSKISRELGKKEEKRKEGKAGKAPLIREHFNDPR